MLPDNENLSLSPAPVCSLSLSLSLSLLSCSSLAGATCFPGAHHAVRVLHIRHTHTHIRHALRHEAQSAPFNFLT